MAGSVGQIAETDVKDAPGDESPLPRSLRLKAHLASQEQNT